MQEHRKYPSLIKSSLYTELYGKLLANVEKETLLRKYSAHALHKKKQVSEVL